MVGLMGQDWVSLAGNGLCLMTPDHLSWTPGEENSSIGGSSPRRTTCKKSRDRREAPAGTLRRSSQRPGSQQRELEEAPKREKEKWPEKGSLCYERLTRSGGPSYPFYRGLTATWDSVRKECPWGLWKACSRAGWWVMSHRRGRNGGWWATSHLPVLLAVVGSSPIEGVAGMSGGASQKDGGSSDQDGFVLRRSWGPSTKRRGCRGGDGAVQDVKGRLGLCRAD